MNTHDDRRPIKKPIKKPIKSDLRKKAEKHLERSLVRAGPDEYDALKLLHEIEVHQVELLMQNDSLHEATEKAETALAQYANLYDFAPVGYLTLDHSGIISKLNIMAESLLEVQNQKLLHQSIKSFVHDDSMPALEYALDTLFKYKHDRASCELVITGQKQTQRYLQFEANFDHTQMICRATIMDISERKRVETSLEIAASVYETISEAVMIVDANLQIIAINPAFTHINGYSAQEAIGQTSSLLTSNHHDSYFYQEMWEKLNDTGHWQGEIWNSRKNTEVYPGSLEINTIYDEKGCPMRYVALSCDLTEQKENEELIWHQANYDPLTGLANRRLFNNQLALEIKKSARNKAPLALLFIDLDRFKEVNDSHGHDKGDMLLIETSRRLVNCVRETDTVARLGGDEFIVILVDLHSAAHTDFIAQNIIDQLRLPFVMEIQADVTLSSEVHVSASIGISVFPDDASNTSDLLTRADQAMYFSKKKGRNCYSYFTQSMQDIATKRATLSHDLRSALKEKQFVVYYQPIIDLATGNIHKAEALLRWRHPQLGFINPEDFIPLAEETGMIIEIGNWVFQQAIECVQQLRQKQYPTFQISVNRSPVQFHRDQEDGVFSWYDYLQKIQLARQSICIEITEGLLLDPSINTGNSLAKLRESGIDISLDDFGTGYSSLTYLKKFPINYLKIDQSFVNNLENSSDDVALCEAIIVMAHKLSIQVIAEGVTTQFQADCLKDMGCDYAQGFLYSQAVPVKQLDQYLSVKSSAVE